MGRSRIGIINYGMGNLHSVLKAFEKSGASPVLLDSPENVADFDKIVVPGVGAFGDAMNNLSKWGFVNAIKKFMKSGRPYLGICLGMQILVEKSHEKGLHQGLELIKGEVIRFPEGQKIPQIGWNQLRIAHKDCPLLKGIPDAAYFYFVHSYYVKTEDPASTAALTDYGVEYTSFIAKENIFGVQFHPEKSQKWGLKILENFVNL